MNVASIIWAALYAIIVGFLAYMILVALNWNPQPWAVIIGILVFLGCMFSGVPARRL